MKTTRLLSVLSLTIGLVGSAAAFDTEGDIEDRVQASPVSTPTAAAVEHVRYPFESEGDIENRLLVSLGAGSVATTAKSGARYAFRSEGDIHDQWFGAPAPRADRARSDAATRYAFRSEGDFNSLPVMGN